MAKAHLSLSLSLFLSVPFFANATPVERYETSKRTQAVVTGEHCFTVGGDEILKLSSTTTAVRILDVLSGTEFQMVTFPASDKDLADAKEFVARQKVEPNKLFARRDLQVLQQFSITTANNLAYVNEGFSELKPENRPYIVQKVLVLQTTGDQRLHVYVSRIDSVSTSLPIANLSQMTEVACQR